ncbi:MAG: dihydrodipicolinate synthase family protein [Desulfurococcaceae archaeon]
MSKPLPSPRILDLIRRGVPIVAHPLALSKERKFDETRQRALTAYYVSSGAGGIAIGVHTTQFKLHDPKIGLYEPLLRLTSEFLDECEKVTGEPLVKVAGVLGQLSNAIREAELARDLGYHAALVSVHHLRGCDYEKILEYIKAISNEIAIFGFYLQPAVGGLKLGYRFWCRLFEEVENVVAVKVAPFNRYYTLDVVRALVDSEREDEIALYTGNDDAILFDLLSVYKVKRRGEYVAVKFAGGLLGHWAFWTKRSMEIFYTVVSLRDREEIPRDVVTLAHQITDVNGAVFDAFNDFKGCIPGIHEVLRRSGLLETNLTLDPEERLSPGQLEEIDRVYHAYPHLRDDAFVLKHLSTWLEGKCVKPVKKPLSVQDLLKPLYVV